MWDENENTVMIPTFSQGSFFADRYRIDSLLGSGAMGRVYAATELYGENRRVALKVLHKERMAEEDTVERFQREAEVLASIGHPCIVKIHTFHHTSDGVPYLAMELLEGVTLKTRLQNGGRFEDPAELQPIVDGICGALSLAHKRGVVHRDMKPDNLFLIASGNPPAKLVDFGLSRLQKTDKSLTHSGMILGTPRYMAPEQIKDAASAGPRGDIYSLGVIIFECLTGQSPYPAEDYGQLLGCVLEARTRRLDSLRPELKPAIGEVVAKALQGEPADRFSSCEELADAYGAAIGARSRRQVIASAAEASASEPKRPRKMSSGAGLIESKSSTLAFDASAAREMLGQLADAAPHKQRPRQPPPPSMGELSVPSAQPPGSAFGHAAEHTEPETFPSGHSAKAHQRVPDMAPSQSPAHVAPHPDHSAPDFNPADHPPAQGGDTMFLPSTELQPPPHMASPPNAYPQNQNASNPNAFSHPGAYHPPQQQPPPQHQRQYPPTQQHLAQPAAKKGRGFGLFAFFIVLLLGVIVVSAFGGLALRAYMHGELPGMEETTELAPEPAPVPAG